jgi:pyruvate carboxylase subunit B
MASSKDSRKKNHKSKEKKDKKGKKDTEIIDFSLLEIGGTVYKTTFPKHYDKRKKWRPKDIGEIESLITGVVKDIYVKKGDTIQRGDCILLLEAMKMNNEILSPIDGIVQDVFVTEKTNIPKGTLMVKIVEQTDNVVTQRSE